MQFRVDRDLPVPIRAQLQGLIEYGIACGELRAGEALPSVRELAETLRVAPMTVSQVYRELKSAGLIDTRPGSGTFVADSLAARTAGRTETRQLQSRIDALIDEGRALGIRSSELASLFNARLFYRDALGPRTAVVMVGLFPAATASYARAIAARIGERATVAPMVLADLERDGAQRMRAASADLVVTFANRHREIEALLPNTRVVAVSFLPSEETRRALAALDPMARIAAVSRFPEFLPIMMAGVRRFAPHVGDVAGGHLGAEGLPALLAGRSAVVFATGAEDVLPMLGAGVEAIEYRHTPDPGDIDRLVLPALEAPAALTHPQERQVS
jgi:DNA-binding transcriptional regulator YhcF (GntR family)